MKPFLSWGYAHFLKDRAPSTSTKSTGLEEDEIDIYLILKLSQSQDLNITEELQENLEWYVTECSPLASSSLQWVVLIPSALVQRLEAGQSCPNGLSNHFRVNWCEATGGLLTGHDLWFASYLLRRFPNKQWAKSRITDTSSANCI